MKAKVIQLVPVEKQLAEGILLKGNKAKEGNPYRRYTTKWYLWDTGRRQVKLTRQEASYIVELLRQRGYPIL